MNANSKFDAFVWRDADVALDEAVLHLDRAPHRIHNASELDEAAVTGALDDASMMRGDGRIDKVAPQPSEPRQGAILVGAGEPTVADDVGDQDGCNFPGLAHEAPLRHQAA